MAGPIIRLSICGTRMVCRLRRSGRTSPNCGARMVYRLRYPGRTPPRNDGRIDAWGRRLHTCKCASESKSAANRMRRTETNHGAEYNKVRTVGCPFREKLTHEQIAFWISCGFGMFGLLDLWRFVF